MAELTDSGLKISTLTEILGQIERDETADISPTLDLSTSSAIGQINRLFARAQATDEEALGALYAALDFDSASGDALFRLGALRGTIREPAQASRVTAVCSLAAGSYPAGSLSCYPSGRPSDLFRNAATVIAAIPGPYAVVMECQTTGPVQVAINALVFVPSAGFTGIVSNTAGIPGKDIESEAAFRARSNLEISRPGSSSAAGIAADLTAEIPEIVSAFVVSNDSDLTVDSIPPHAIEAVVFGPDPATDADNDRVAAQILASKAGGIGTYGLITRTVLDSQGIPHAVKFTRPVNVPITVTITVRIDAQTFAGTGAVADEIASRALAYQGPGIDAAWSQIASWALGVPGVRRVTAISLNGGAFADVTISSRQRATIASAAVTVTAITSEP